jgi:crotonobetainyl-CoA:carnitine CoA-transferase CaiB-like acyl-CoA transferase
VEATGSVTADPVWPLWLVFSIAIPAGWALDKEGAPTTDPRRATILMPAGVPMGAINTLDAVVQHPQVAARGALVPCDHPVAGRIRMVGPPVRMSETPGSVHAPAPLLGENTDDVLKERLGLDDDEIATLRRKNVIR